MICCMVRCFLRALGGVSRSGGVLVLAVVFEGSANDLRDFAGVDVYTRAEAGHFVFFQLPVFITFFRSYERCNIRKYAGKGGFY